MKTNRLFNYPGSKRKISDKINELCSKLNYENWVEPFCGSAAIFYNLNQKISKSHLNDRDENVISMHQACKDFDYNVYLTIVNSIDRKFGDVKVDKNAYYNFRTWWNEDGSRTSLAGLYLIYLSSMCINSMLRFGPHGMNQGWGARKSIIEEDEWNEMHNKLQNTILTSKDFHDVEISERSFIFLDPPYEFQDNGLYGKGFSQNDFIEWLKTKYKNVKHCLWIYTDSETEKSNELLELNFRKIIIRDMKTIAPSKQKTNTSTEVMYVGLS